MSYQDKKKIANLYVEPETHAALKRLAVQQETTMQAVAARFLDELQPVLKEIADAYDAIKTGENTQKVLNSFMANSLKIAASNLENDE
jgi:hypothetical protein